MKLYQKLTAAAALAVAPTFAFAQSAQDGNDVVARIVTFLGSLGWGLLAAMVLFGLYCMWVFGTSLQKMGDDDNQREEVKPKTLVLSLLGAIVCTYGTYTLGVGMRTIFNDNAQSNGQATFTLPTAPGGTPTPPAGGGGG